MKALKVLAIFLTILTSSFAQNDEIDNLLSLKWRTNFVVGSENYQATLMQNNIELTQVNESPFGDFIQFNKDGTFVSYNQGPCGNECRIRVYGNYIFQANDKIEFIVERIEYHKMCIGTPTKLVNKSLGLYTITSKDSGYIFSRVEEN